MESPAPIFLTNTFKSSEVTMPPKGSKAPKAAAKAKGDAASSGGDAPEAVVDVSVTDVKVELEVGESDKVNLAYIENSKVPWKGSRGILYSRTSRKHCPKNH